MAKKTKLGKYEIRKLWILYSLLDCDQWTQKDIKKTWYLLSINHIYGKKRDAINGFLSESIKETAYQKILEKYKDYVIEDQNLDLPENEEEKIKEEFKNIAINLALKEIDKTKKTFSNIDSACKSDISMIMKELIGKKIVKNETIIKTVVPKHTKPMETAYSLNENYHVLFRILDEINNPLTPNSFKDFMLGALMKSEYIKRVVNGELIKTIEKKLHLSLNDDDRKLLLFCLKTYPNVLYNTLKETNKPLKMINENTPLLSIVDPKKHTNAFVLDIKNWAYNDMKSGEFNVEYEITVTITDDEGNLIKHTNSNQIHDPEEEEYMKMSGRAYLKAATGIDLNPDNKSIKNDIEFKKQVKMWNNFNKIINDITESQTEYVNSEIKDETTLLKDNGEKINFLRLYVPKDAVPY